MGSDERLEPRRPTHGWGRVRLHHQLCLIGICLLAVAVTVRAGGARGVSSLLNAQATGSQTKPSAPPSGSPAKPAPQTGSQPTPSAPQGGYVGTDTCVTCHTDQEESLKGTPHGNAKNPRSPMSAHGCESCHGPGQAHVDDDASGHIAKMKELKPGEVESDLPDVSQPRDARCMGRQRARPSQSVVHDVPQRAQSEVARTPARQEDADRSVRHVSSHAGCQDRTSRGAHASARGQVVLLVVS